jgi:myo-inositol 2-dehydrogenase/D-chiro-inositol 1-dehydrogenase
MGRTHLRALERARGVEPAAVVEPVASLRAELEAAGLRTWPDLEALLSSGGVDAAVIAAPTDLHLELVVRLAAAGLPILCEKPCGLHPDETARAARAAADAGVVLQVGYWRRFVPALVELRKRLRSGAFGVPLLLSCWQWDAQPPPSSFRERSDGILLDMGVHEFDQLRWLTGQDIAGLAAVASGEAPDGVADADGAQVVLTLSGGATGFVSLGRYFPVGDAVWAEAFGTRGHERCDVIDPAEGEMAQLEALRRQAESFAAFAAGKGPCEGATADDAVAALTAAEQVTAAIPALRGGRENVSDSLPPSYRHQAGG